MFRFSLLFFCFGLIAFAAGSTHVAGLTMDIGRVLLAACLIISILSGVTAIMGRESFRDPL